MNNPNPINNTNKSDVYEINEDWKSHPMVAMIKSSASGSKNSNHSFVNHWTKLILLVHSYNFFTAFFFLGIAGFPTGFWFVCEMLSEIILISDFVFREVLRSKFPEIWKGMQLIHN